MPRRDADRRLAAVRRQVGAQVRAVEVGDHPGRERQPDRDRVRLAEAVVDQDQADRAADRRALRLRDEGAGAARDEQDLARRASPSAACRGCCSGRSAEPQRCDSTGLPSRAHERSRRRRAAGRALDQAPGSFAPPALWSGTAPSDGGPPTTPSAGAKTCEFDVAATEIASGAVPGEPAVPRPKSSRSLPAAITGTTPASAMLRTALVHRVVRRVGLRAAAREVDHVHAVGDRRLERAARSPACSPGGRAASAP